MINITGYYEAIFYVPSNGSKNSLILSHHRGFYASRVIKGHWLVKLPITVQHKCSVSYQLNISPDLGVVNDKWEPSGPIRGIFYFNVISVSSLENRGDR